MASGNRPTPKRDWYKVSVDTLRMWGVLFVLAVVGVVGFFGYRVLEERLLERQLVAVMDEARELLTSVQGEPGLEAYRDEYRSALDSLQEATSRAGDGSMGEALRHAERSRTLLSSILNALRHRGPAGEAQFISAQGDVEFRRGERGEWQRARSRDVLYAGDYVKTARNSSAEFMTADGTVFTVRADTVILVSSAQAASGPAGARAIALEYGWVNLSTADSGGRISTPGAEAAVASNSQAVVAYDQNARKGRFASYRGQMEVTPEGGETQVVQALEQVVQTGSQLSAPKPLPPAPQPIEPAADLVYPLAETPQIVLVWDEVPGAERYALQVSSNRMFVKNIIDVDNRETTRATVGVQGAGSFVWRVAAFGDEGVKGPWSEIRAFRIVESERRPEVSSYRADPSYRRRLPRTVPAAETTFHRTGASAAATGETTRGET